MDLIHNSTLLRTGILNHRFLFAAPAGMQRLPKHFNEYVFLIVVQAFTYSLLRNDSLFVVHRITLGLCCVAALSRVTLSGASGCRDSDGVHKA